MGNSYSGPADNRVGSDICNGNRVRSNNYRTHPETDPMTRLHSSAIVGRTWF